MAYTYNLQMETDAGEEYVRALVLAHGGFERRHDGLVRPGVVVFVNRRDPAEPSSAYFRQVSVEDFGIAPDIGVVFQIDKFEHTDEGVDIAITLAVSLSGALSQEARLTYVGDPVAFVRRGGALVLDQTWVSGNPHLVALVTEPYTVEDVRAQDAARAAAAEAASRGAAG